MLDNEELTILGVAMAVVALLSALKVKANLMEMLHYAHSTATITKVDPDVTGVPGVSIVTISFKDHGGKVTTADGIPYKPDINKGIAAAINVQFPIDYIKDMPAYSAIQSHKGKMNIVTGIVGNVFSVGVLSIGTALIAWTLMSKKKAKMVPKSLRKSVPKIEESQDSGMFW